MRPPGRELLDAVPGLRGQLRRTVALGIGEAAATVAQGLLLAHLIAIGVDQRGSAIGPALAGLVAAVLLRAALQAWAETSGRATGRRAVAILRERAVGRALARAARTADERPGAVAAAWVHGADAVAAYAGRYLPASVVAAVTPLIVLVAVAAVDPLSAGLLAVAAPLVVVFLILVGHRAQAAADRRHAALALLGGHLLDVLRGLPVLQAHDRDRAQAAQVRRAGEHYREGTMATLREAFLSGLVLEFMAMLGTALVAVACGIRLAEGMMDFGPAIAALVLAPEVFLPLRRLGSEYHAAADAEPLLRELATAAGDEAGPAAATGTEPAPDPRHAPIVLEAVSVRHEDRRTPALDRLDATLMPGATTILHGPSGSGKTTLLRVLLGLTAVDAGSVRCGDVDLAAVDPEAWRRRIAWIPQHPVLLPASLADNVRFGGEADDDAVRQALAAVGLDGLETALDAGLATALGDGGQPLSAGERRRLAIARALLRDPALVLVDEPTANLDQRSAEQVVDALAGLLRGRTAVVATHDPLPWRLGDRALALRAGTVATEDADPVAPVAVAGAGR
ncbi:thiol reductant ABC exporter subunit CydD [Patulibacter defluvii]|uniref:thiol reductant ABC exporter subunit CydD n=1 Tax=Patulibacter defluvii TaxID=3095358 RepID=UPI002A75CDAC|nr:thiol reductant ABC exporter subunit CydD [Patulibacter sp. DM4]